jgi:hypothetical protein
LDFVLDVKWVYQMMTDSSTVHCLEKGKERKELILPSMAQGVLHGTLFWFF